ncbi:hypothetical protein MMC15_000670 [Xylographa vitiligo]|nr:hypothetical protein [Xylographa vitiligo]
MAHRGIIGHGVLIDHVAYRLKHEESSSSSTKSPPQARRVLLLPPTRALDPPLRTPSRLRLPAPPRPSRRHPLHPQQLHHHVRGPPPPGRAGAAARTPPNPPTYSGVKTGEEVAHWVWDSRFTAAVAADTPSVEAWRACIRSAPQPPSASSMQTPGSISPQDLPPPSTRSPSPAGGRPRRLAVRARTPSPRTAAPRAGRASSSPASRRRAPGGAASPPERGCDGLTPQLGLGLGDAHCFGTPAQAR